MESGQGSEIERIRDVYRARDRSADGPTPWRQRAYRLRLQQLEFELLDALELAGLDPKGLRVLEVGCGSGYFLSRFVDYGAGRATGIDLMEERIALARARDPRLELVAGNAATLPWPEGTFDLVTQFTCLSSVLDPSVRRSITAEMWRVVRAGGATLSYDVRSPPALVRTIRSAASLRHRGRTQPPRTPTSPVDAAEFRQWFPNASIRIKSITLAPDLASLTRRSVPLMQTLQQVPALQTHLLVLAQKVTECR